MTKEINSININNKEEFKSTLLQLGKYESLTFNDSFNIGYEDLKNLKDWLNNNKSIKKIQWNENNLPKDQYSTSLINEIKEKVHLNNANSNIFPNSHILALLSLHAHEELTLSEIQAKKVEFSEASKVIYNHHLTNWEIVEEIKSEENAYYARIYRNKSSGQLVLANRGANFSLGKLFKNNKASSEAVRAIFYKQQVTQIANAYAATVRAVELAKETGSSLTFTGHLFGALLAEICLFFAYILGYTNVAAKTTQSPGSEKLINLMRSNLINIENNVDLSRFNISTDIGIIDGFVASDRHINQARLLSPKIESKGGFLEQLKKINKKYKSALSMVTKSDPAVNLDMIEIFNSLNGIGLLINMIDCYDPMTGEPTSYKEIVDMPLCSIEAPEETLAGSIAGVLGGAVNFIPGIPSVIGNFIKTTLSSVLENTLSENALFNMIDVAINMCQSKNTGQLMAALGSPDNEYDQKFVAHLVTRDANPFTKFADDNKETLEWYLVQIYKYKDSIKISPDYYSLNEYAARLFTTLSSAYEVKIVNGKTVIISINEKYTIDSLIGMCAQIFRLAPNFASIVRDIKNNNFRKIRELNDSINELRQLIQNGSGNSNDNNQFASLPEHLSSMPDRIREHDMAIRALKDYQDNSVIEQENNKKELTVIKSNIEATKSILEQFAQENSGQNKEILALKENLSILQKNISSAAENGVHSAKEMSEIRLIVSGLTEKIGFFVNYINSNDNDKDKLKSSIDEFKNIIKNIQIFAEQNRDYILEIAASVNVLKESIISIKEVINVHSSKFVGVEQELKSINTEISSLKSSLDQLYQEVNELREEQKAIKQHVSSMSENISAMYARIEEFGKQIAQITITGSTRVEGFESQVTQMQISESPKEKLYQDKAEEFKAKESEMEGLDAIGLYKAEIERIEPWVMQGTDQDKLVYAKLQMRLGELYALYEDNATLDNPKACFKKAVPILKELDDKNKANNLYDDKEQFRLLISSFQRLRKILDQNAKTKGGDQGCGLHHIAARYDYPDVMAYLVNANNINQQSGTLKRTALWYAASCGSVNVVKYLVTQCSSIIDITIRDADNSSCINAALRFRALEVVKFCYEGYKNHINELSQKLIKQLEDLTGPDFRAIHNYSPLHFLASNDSNIELYKYIRSLNRFDENSTENNPKVPVIIVAAQHGSVKIIDYIVQNNSYVKQNIKSISAAGKENSFLRAIAFNKKEVVEYFLNKNLAQLEDKIINDQGKCIEYSAMTHAIRHGAYSVVSYLLSKQIQFDKETSLEVVAKGISDKDYCLKFSTPKNYIELAKILLANSALPGRYINGVMVAFKTENGELQRLLETRAVEISQGKFTPTPQPVKTVQVKPEPMAVDNNNNSSTPSSDLIPKLIKQEPGVQTEQYNHTQSFEQIKQRLISEGRYQELINLYQEKIRIIEQASNPLSESHKLEYVNLQVGLGELYPVIDGNMDKSKTCFKKAIDILMSGNNANCELAVQVLAKQKAVFDKYPQMKGSDEGYTLLHVAARYNYQSLFKYVFELFGGTNLLNQPTKGFNKTPAWYAAACGSIEVLKYMTFWLDNKIDLGIRDKNGLSVAQAAMEFNNFEVVELFFSVNPWKGKNSSIQIEKLIDKATFDIAKTNYSPLHIAAMKSNVEIFKLLESLKDYNNGIATNRYDINDILNGYRDPVIVTAAKGGNVEVFNYIITTYPNIKANIKEIKNIANYNSLKIAILYKKQNILDYLLDNQLFTVEEAFKVAVQFGKSETVNDLIYNRKFVLDNSSKISSFETIDLNIGDPDYLKITPRDEYIKTARILLEAGEQPASKKMYNQRPSFAPNNLYLKQLFNEYYSNQVNNNNAMQL